MFCPVSCDLSWLQVMQVHQHRQGPWFMVLSRNSQAATQFREKVQSLQFCILFDFYHVSKSLSLKNKNKKNAPRDVTRGIKHHTYTHLVLAPPSDSLTSFPFQSHSKHVKAPTQVVGGFKHRAKWSLRIIRNNSPQRVCVNNKGQRPPIPPPLPPHPPPNTSVTPRQPSIFGHDPAAAQLFGIPALRVHLSLVHHTGERERAKPGDIPLYISWPVLCGRTMSLFEGVTSVSPAGPSV